MGGVFHLDHSRYECHRILFPFHGFTPAIGVGIISLIVLAATIFACYARRLAGVWSLIYVITAMIALYLNVFVLIVQLFQKVPALRALAPTQSEPPFVVTQLIALTLFVVLAIIASRRFRITPVTTPAAAECQIEVYRSGRATCAPVLRRHL